jgi:hypothetical protein
VPAQRKREDARMRRLIAPMVAAVVLAVLVLGACGDGGDNSADAPPSSTLPDATTTTPASAAPTTVNTTPVVTDVFPTVSLPCQPVPTPTEPKTSPGQPREVYLSNVQLAGDECVDHVVFSVTSEHGDAPGYEVVYAPPPFAQDGSGEPVDVAGDAFIVVRLRPAYGYDFVNNRPTYSGPKRIPTTDANHVTEVVQLGDFEGVITWVIGLDSKRPFTVESTAGTQAQLAVSVA